MGGQPRTTSGDAAMQDGSTPAEFMIAVERRFGRIAFDLAAHAANKKHQKYFAPKTFRVRLKEPKFPESLVTDLAAKGADEYEARAHLHQGCLAIRDGRESVDVYVPNRDHRALGFNALELGWTNLPGVPHSKDPLWLNCEWADVPSWSAKCEEEQAKGARILLLTHVAVADWARDRLFGGPDVYLLSGRLCFDGKNVLPKDCMLSHFHTAQLGSLKVWDWRRDVITSDWSLVARRR